MRLRWEEWPANWIEGQWFEHCLAFQNGPFARLCTSLRLEASGEGSRATYRIEVVPRNAVGKLLLATVFFPSFRRTIAPLLANAGAFTSGG